MITTFPPQKTGTSYTETNTYADLPTPGSDNAGKVYIVKTTTGVWVLGTKKNAGLYRSDGVSWNYLGNSVSIDDSQSSLDSVWSSIKVESLIGGRISAAEKGIPNGVATLDANGRVPMSQVDSKYVVDQRILEIEGMFKEANSTMHTEYVNTDGKLSNINIRSNDINGTLIFTKTLSYDDSVLNTIVLTDLSSGCSIETVFEYNGSGELIGKFKTLTMA